MSPLGVLLVVVVTAVPIAWIVSEFRSSRMLRIALGVLTIGVVATSVWGVTALLTRFNYNAWYGSATGDLVSTSLQQVEDGHLERVLTVWRGLDRLYRPTYENRARYDELVEEATARMRGDTPIETGSPGDASLFTSETWLGHWEDGFGYWVVINDLGRPFDIVQSGQTRAKVHDVSISPDFRVLKFKEGGQWLHTLTLRNRYEASYEWFDLQKGTVWDTQPMHKLVRASGEQKAMTQQAGAATRSQPTSSETNRIPSAAGSGR
jgi:hypothetical protein